MEYLMAALTFQHFSKSSQVSRTHPLYSIKSADHPHKDITHEYKKPGNLRLRRQHKYISQEARLHYRHKEVKPLPNKYYYNILSKWGGALKYLPSLQFEQTWKDLDPSPGRWVSLIWLESCVEEYWLAFNPSLSQRLPLSFYFSFVLFLYQRQLHSNDNDHERKVNKPHKYSTWLFLAIDRTSKQNSRHFWLKI